MNHRILFALATLLLASTPALSAQTIRGQLLEEGRGKAIDAALVVLLDESGKQLAGSLTDPLGRFTLQAPRPAGIGCGRSGSATARRSRRRWC